MDDFEQNFCSPYFEFEKFDEFLQRFPDANFNKGISKKEVLLLFKKFRYHLNREPTEDFYRMTHQDAQAALSLGLLATIDIRKNPKKYWETLLQNDLREACKKHNIPTAAKGATMIERLVAQDAAYPYAVVLPSPLLQEVYDSFINLYIQDIRIHTDHFHPLYFESLWEAVQSDCYNNAIRARIEEILETPYWADRLYSYTPPEDENAD